MSRMVIRLTVGLVVSALAVTGCVGAGADRAKSGGALSAGVPAWFASGLRAVSSPVIEGDRVLMYAANGDGALSVVALDARTGRRAWALSASDSAVTQGVAPSLPVAGGRVFVLRQASEYGPVAARLTAVQVRTGDQVWVDRPRAWVDWPEVCAQEVCGSTSDRERLALDVRTGAEQDRVAGLGREIGPGLFDTGR
ncbi:MAG: PQQ-binding-like beta-propeller repeat protein, partial [Phycicoccus sp.]